MTKAAAKITTKANADHNLIALGRRILKLRKEQIETGSNAAHCDDAVVAARARIDDVDDRFDQTYEEVLQVTPKTMEGCRALAQAIAAKCARTNEISAPESDYERGVAALLRALGVDPLPSKKTPICVAMPAVTSSARRFALMALTICHSSCEPRLKATEARSP